MGCFWGCGGGYAAPATTAPVGYGGGFALIVVLFILLIIIGCACWGGY
ncbi:YjcZ family sporulation protein [Peribacillus sp. SCS-155]